MSKERNERLPRRRPRSDRSDATLNSQSRPARKSSTDANQSGGLLHPILYFIIIALIGSVVYVGLYIYTQRNLRRVVTPIDAEKVVGGADHMGGADRFWGSYRPHVYFGLKTRSPRSPVLGLMWFSQSVQQLQIRHWCDHNDRLKKFGWTAHDGRTFGRQEILDDSYSLSTEFVKRPGGDNGGDWTSRITVKPLVRVVFRARSREGTPF